MQAHQPGPGGTSKPSWSFLVISSTPSTSLATIGNPTAIFPMMDRDMFSENAE
jgi:hypothetical protein